VLNVLRFPSTKEDSIPSPLSEKGQKILYNASELCYLTQVVIRLFEDTQKPPEDPKRFRVEILFSPGATATPRHMAELYREKDATRFDTEKLQKISKEGLTGTQVEEFFEQAIREGKTSEDFDESSKGTDISDVEKETKKKAKKDKSSKNEVLKSSVNCEKCEKTENIVTAKIGNEVAAAAATEVTEENALCKKEDKPEAEAVANNLGEDSDVKEQQEEEECDERFQCDVPTANHVWRNAAVAGVLIGASCCLFMAAKMAKRR
jgi:hypothetical protein